MSIWISALLLAATPATDETLVDLSTLPNIAAALQDAGYRAEVKKDKDGDYIVSSINGSEFTVWPVDCDKGPCSSIDLVSRYKAEPLFTPALANEWNSNNRFLTATIDDKGQLVEWSYLDPVGKLTRKNFIDQIEWYGSMDAKLAKFVDKKRAAAK